MAEITGTNGNDTKNGGAEADVIRLLGGNDRSYGYDGNDTMVGGWADDTLYGYDDNDRINGGGGVDVLEGGNGNDRVAGGGGDDDLGGGYGNDTLDGGSGRDTLEGSYGDDVIDGGAGRDQLDGGSGADRFAFDEGDSGVGSDVRDVIYRVDANASDRIDLRAIDANTGASGDQAFTFIGNSAEGASFTAAGQIRVVPLDSNGNPRTDPDALVYDYLIQLNTGGSLDPDIEILVTLWDSDPSATWFLP